MQTLYIVSIHDTKHKYYHRPVLCDDIKAATRSFYDVINDSKSQLSQHPDQYTMEILGTITSDDEKITIEKTQRLLLSGTQALEAKQLEEKENVTHE